MKEPFLWDRALGLNYGFKPKVTACEFNIFFFFFYEAVASITPLLSVCAEE